MERSIEEQLLSNVATIIKHDPDVKRVKAEIASLVEGGASQTKINLKLEELNTTVAGIRQRYGITK